MFLSLLARRVVHAVVVVADVAVVPPEIAVTLPEKEETEPVDDPPRLPPSREDLNPRRELEEDHEEEEEEESLRQFTVPENSCESGVQLTTLLVSASVSNNTRTSTLG